MIYEARQPARLNWALAIACGLLSIIGFAVAGIIPTAGDAYPLIGGAIIAVCFATSAIFIGRARNRSAIVRADAGGLYARPFSDATLPWDAIEGIKLLSVNRQVILRVKLRDSAAYPARPGLLNTLNAIDNKLSYGDFGINPRFYDYGMSPLVATILHYRPDLSL